MPVCFIGTNHTTGGNSGSPARCKGNLIGLNFDRVWEGTMSDIYYDPTFAETLWSIFDTFYSSLISMQVQKTY
jgi:hypothetical protein